MQFELMSSISHLQVEFAGPLRNFNQRYLNSDSHGIYTSTEPGHSAGVDITKVEIEWHQNAEVMFSQMIAISERIVNLNRVSNIRVAPLFFLQCRSLTHEDIGELHAYLNSMTGSVDSFKTSSKTFGSFSGAAFYVFVPAKRAYTVRGNTEGSLLGCRYLIVDGLHQENMKQFTASMTRGWHFVEIYEWWTGPVPASGSLLSVGKVAINELWPCSLHPPPLNASFSLEYGGAVTEPLSLYSSPSEVQSALEALPTIGIVSVSSGGRPQVGLVNGSATMTSAVDLTGDKQLQAWCTVLQLCGWNVSFYSNVLPTPLRLLETRMLDATSPSMQLLRVPLGRVDGVSHYRRSTEVATSRLLRSLHGCKSFCPLLFEIPRLQLVEAQALPYTVRVRGSNLFGYGPWTSLSVLPPAPPATVRARVLSPDRALLTFSAPSHNHGGLVSKANVQWETSTRMRFQQQRVELAFAEGSNGGWVEVDRNLFDTSNDGWAPVKSAAGLCGKWGAILGGPEATNDHPSAAGTRVFDLQEWPHTGVRITFDFLFIDQWVLGDAELLLDGVQIWNHTRVPSSHGDTFLDSPACGKDELFDLRVAVDVWMVHRGPQLNLTFQTSMRDEEWTTMETDFRSWGVDNVTVFVTRTEPSLRELYAVAGNPSLWDKTFVEDGISEFNYSSWEADVESNIYGALPCQFYDSTFQVSQ
jgi:hypothetical protein